MIGINPNKKYKKTSKAYTMCLIIYKTYPKNCENVLQFNVTEVEPFIRH